MMTDRYSPGAAGCPARGARAVVPSSWLVYGSARPLTTPSNGLPGVAWVKLDANAEWPQNLSLRVPE